MRRVILLLLAAAVLISSLIGCGKLEDAFVSEDEKLEMTNFPAEITDNLGNRLRVEKPAKKVVCTDYTTLNTVGSLGLRSQIVGYNSSDLRGELILYLLPELKETEDVAGTSELDCELINSLEADVVFMPWQHRKFSAELSNRSVVITAKLEHKGAVMSTIFAISTLTCDSSTQANLITDEYKRVLDMLEAKSYKIPFDNHPEVLFLGEEDMFTTIPADSTKIINTIMSYGAAENAADITSTGEDIVRFKGEQLDEWKPNVIWIPYYAKYTIDDVINDPDFSKTDAVKNGRIYIFPGAIEPWYENTVSSCLGSCWALYNLYPSEFKKEELIETAQSFYKTIYGIDFTEEQFGIE